MKTPSKKPAQKPNTKGRATSNAASIAALKKTIAAQAQEIREGLEQQNATSEIMRVIASLPTDIQPVLDAVAENASRLCEASDALIFRVNGDRQQRVANYGSMPVLEETFRSLERSNLVGRAILDRETIHIHDLAASESDFPNSKTRGIAMGVRTALVAPLLRKGVSIGAIYVRRKEVRPFTDRQIKLFETFADQAVIAIENVRLFNELKESLEQQTATSEILGVIASSPTEIQPVLDVIAENAARVCGADDAMIRLSRTMVFGWQLTMDRSWHMDPISRGLIEGLYMAERYSNGK